MSSLETHHSSSSSSSTSPTRRGRRKRSGVKKWVIVAAALVVTAVAAAFALRTILSSDEGPDIPEAVADATATVDVVEGVPDDATLINDPSANGVFTFLPTDPNPDADATDQRVMVVQDVAVYAEPGGEVVGYLSPTTYETQTILPVFEVDGDYGMVPVFARAGLPSDGVTGQAVAWVRLDDPAVQVTTDDTSVVVDLSDLTVSIYDGDTLVESLEGIGIGTFTWETPTGRTAIAARWTDPNATYTQHGDEWTIISSLARFSDVRDSFVASGDDSASSPLIALHYHSTLGGAVSSGCIRLDYDINAAIAELPIGTPVYVQE